MSEEKIPTGIKTSLGLGSIFASFPIEIRTIIGLIFVFFIFIGGFTVLSKLPSMLDNKCWELQFRDERVFRFNSCSGTVVELDNSTMEPKITKE